MDERRYDPAEWEHGLRCADCGREFTPGQPICERLEAMTEFANEPTPIVLIVCLECDLGHDGRSVG